MSLSKDMPNLIHDLNDTHKSDLNAIHATHKGQALPQSSSLFLIRQAQYWFFTLFLENT